jgi:hypothetical protein
VTRPADGDRDEQGHRGAGALRGPHAVGRDSGGGARPRPARAARHPGRGPRRLRATRGRQRASAADRDRRLRRDGLCAGLAGDGPAHGRAAQRAGGALHRAVRGASLRLVPGRGPGPADGPRRRRVARALGQGHAGRADPRLRGRRPRRGGAHPAAARSSERAGAASRRGGGGRTAAATER